MKHLFLVFCVCVATSAWAAETYPEDLLKDAKFRKAYHAMLGQKKAVKWLGTLSGPAEPPKKVTEAGGEFLSFHICKPHDCAEHNMVVLYSASTSRCYAKLSEAGEVSKLGDPNAQISAALDRLYQEAWGQVN